MKHIKSIFILLNLGALLFYFHYSVNQKEQTINDGQLILLELAPVDPRSLMQGDYMRLRYALANDINNNELKLKQGYCVVELDTNNVAQFIRVQEDRKGIAENEHIIKFSGAGHKTSLGAESYFFEEGQAEIFDFARYGAIRVDKKGNSVLINLCTKNFINMDYLKTLNIEELKN